MIPKVVHAEYIGAFTVRLKFSDGTEGDVDLRGELHGELFEPSRDPELFRQVSVHPEFKTLCWPNGADIAPEFLYEHVQVHA